MSYRIDFLDTGDHILVTLKGTASVDEFKRLLDELLVRPEFRPGQHRLYDLRDAAVELTAEDLREVGAHLASRNRAHGERKVAFLVSRDLSFGVMRMFMALADQLKAEMQVTRDPGEALSWVDLPSDFAFPERPPQRVSSR